MKQLDDERCAYFGIAYDVIINERMLAQLLSRHLRVRVT